jgi:hypothetical protein
MTTTSYRTTVRLPLDPDNRRDVIELLQQYGAVSRARENAVRWELEARDEYTLAETVIGVQSEISWAYQSPIEIPRPRKVPAK